jgi:hypothetical protein
MRATQPQIPVDGPAGLRAERHDSTLAPLASTHNGNAGHDIDVGRTHADDLTDRCAVGGLLRSPLGWLTPYIGYYRWSEPR